MTNYDAIEKCQVELYHMEARLKAVRDNVGQEVKNEINSTLKICQALCSSLNGIDKALLNERTGSIELY